ncbi:MAG TPA: sigma-54 dependent transcriptional regulator [Vicinamibacteria bacterium]|nr:sigma-54 dependent transcriptional regulator [Vicinamibacteria bacterium]
MNPSYRVLIAEDEATYAMTVARFLQERGHEVKVCPTGKAAFKALAETEWDVLLLDLKLPDADGVEILSRVRQEHEDLQTIIVTGFANVDSAISSMRLGAFDYLTKPPNFEELAMRVTKAGEKTLLERENRRLRFQVQRGLSTDFATRSHAMKQVIRTLEKVAASKTPVLIEGESGVGKEILAQHLHRVSPRASRAFIDLNCAAFAASLLESELFGHERGAFTGATGEKPGLVEVADGGTLFLDEVGEMAMELQSKFLRVLDSGTFYRVGATRKRRADFRLVAATNRDLQAEVAAGRFRKDLFYRIHGVKVVVPPLRERPEDIPLLIEHFARTLALPRRFSPQALEALAAHDWPGNVRELRYAVERAGLLAEHDVIDVSDLPPELLSADSRPVASAALDEDEESGREARSLPDPARVRQALEQAKWRRQKAAEILGVSPRTLFRWMQRLGL